ncbi:DNA mismatch repair protein MutT [Sulfitobacter sp. HI0082]|jgi:8-oxo-dGTP pyrophosphatase MutT (NUDIX family)|uniref:DNA mismatch repair protein MutT n=1 Tax=Sulfitobacter profundi TaxID=2679961 RepID=A0ABW1YTK9_9RHOB|nr:MULTISPECIES: NUDIX hydrolase [Sulfitobacter]KZZ28217.1 DNA mismatch repair protein MutT [Sulfitobacter sp. HI0082]HAC48648.1 NUDIX hydrolase [Sulfitobacter sp.]AYE85751.1 DNA mismatch repair protein MutT [Sulfitobacter sp. D7]KZX95132.1 DNA mismatch repair protein MutT [Sulfitobacter sp. HI0021]KZY02334.1 DNA mismatch repair protein MutT [Sulfitobacter sp. HI0027]|tara:strand:+ start:415 stop:1110 length:696 start_codon:yes stop_codon:yes gene_type:complete
MTIDKTKIRNAATVIVLRDRHVTPHILMGQRGAKAAFMPNKFVFPGGAVDATDAQVPLAAPVNALCHGRLCDDAEPSLAHAIAVAAIRELWEETGLVLGRKGAWEGDVPADWQTFAATGHLPDASALQFVFRALTPPGRPRRFDARFFLVDAEDIASDPDDFDAACDELSHLQWVPLSRARSFDMPFITEVVLAEVAARARDTNPPASVPFFKNNDEESLFLRLHGRPMTG